MSCFSLAGAFLARGIHLPDIPKLLPLSVLTCEAEPHTQSKRLVSPCVASLPCLPRGSKPDNTQLFPAHEGASLGGCERLHTLWTSCYRTSARRRTCKATRAKCCVHFAPWLDAIARGPTHSFGGRRCFDAETFYLAAVPEFPDHAGQLASNMSGTRGFETFCRWSLDSTGLRKPAGT